MEPDYTQLTCPVCGKNLTGPGQNEHNRETHIKACKEKKLEDEKQKKGTSKRTLKAFFFPVKAKKSRQSISSNSNENDKISTSSTEIETAPLPNTGIETAPLTNIDIETASITNAEIEIVPLTSTVIGTADTPKNCDSIIDPKETVYDLIDPEPPTHDVDSLHEPTANITEVHKEIDTSEIDPFNQNRMCQVNNVLKCIGFDPKLNSIYKTFPLHLLEEIDVVIEGFVFHHFSCFANQYQIPKDCDTAVLCNTSCSNLQYSNRLQKLIQISQKSATDKDMLTMHNGYLSHQQLNDKAVSLQAEKRDLRLQSLNLQFKNSKLCSTLTLHQRILLYISENNIPRLREVVNVALRNNRSVTYIAEKISQAIDGIYSPNPNQDDKDLAFLVIKFGGPSLLSILHRAGRLPSVSTAYRMSKACKPIESSVKSSVKTCYEQNVKMSEQSKYAVSLKMDETYVQPVMSYCPRDNQVYGICRQHGKNIKTTIETYEDCTKLKEEYDKGDLHVPKECLVAGVMPLNEAASIQVVVMWPTCSKKDIAGTIELINEVNSAVQQTTGAPLMNICTDGDATRRKLCSKILNFTLQSNEPWYHIVANLPFVDLLVGKEGQSVSFDPKHLSKRCWCMFLKDRVSLSGSIVSRSALLKLMHNVEGIENLIYPKDKQNVPSASKFLMGFIDSVNENELPYTLIPIKNQLLLLSKVFQGLLAFFVYVDMSISEQIKSFSISSYTLFYLYQHNKTKLMPSQLYHDMQATFLDALFCCAKGKVYFPTKPLYLVTNGTDPVERLFGNIRMANKGNNTDTMGLVNTARAMAACDDLLINKHPEWSKKSRAQRRITLDYSNPNNWKEDDLKLGEVNVRNCWLNGYHTALSTFPEDANVEDWEIVEVSLRCPLRRNMVVGVGEMEIEEDWSIEDEEDADVVESNDDLENFHEILTDRTAPHEPSMLIDNKKVYKTTILKQITSTQPLSKDRLRRVEGLSRYPTSSNANLDSCDGMLGIGDPIIHKSDKGPMLANITKIMQSNINVQTIDVSQRDLQEIDGVLLSIRPIETKSTDGKLYWTGKYTGESVDCSGKFCAPICPVIDINPPEGLQKFYFDEGLLRDVGVHLQLSIQDESAGPSSLSKRCIVCRKNIDLAEMRVHVASHIVRGDIVGANICGFCGSDAGVCRTTLKTTKKGTQAFYSIEQCDCPCYFSYGRVKKFHKKKFPSTNRVILCPQKSCGMAVWTYNIAAHYTLKHENREIPNDYDLSKEEKNFLKN